MRKKKISKKKYKYVKPELIKYKEKDISNIKINTGTPGTSPGCACKCPNTPSDDYCL